MTPKKISIITVNHNNKIGLKKTIENVLSQNKSDFEFIIIDSGSTDGSLELINNYSRDIDYLASEPDKGIYNAMNKGIKVANGEFVIFMDSGATFYDKNVINKVAPLLENNFDIYYGDSYVIKHQNKEKIIFSKILSFDFFYTRSINRQSVFIRKKMFFDYFLYSEDFKMVSDWEFLIYTICYENRPYKYLQMTISNNELTNISSNVNRKNRDLELNEKNEVFNKYFPHFLDTYKSINSIKSKEIQDIFYIKNFKYPWKLFKGIINFLIIFKFMFTNQNLK